LSGKKYKKNIKKTVVIVVLLLTCTSMLSVSYAENLREFELKAALLYQFSRFITWPETSDNEASFNVCVVGNDPFKHRLEGIKKRRYKNKPIDVKYPENSEQIQHCHIVYLVDPDCTVCQKLKTPALLVSSQKGFVDKGGEIEFIEQSGKVRFKLNRKSLEGKALKVSAKLYEVAVEVVD
jgi:hypothetical protein